MDAARRNALVQRYQRGEFVHHRDCRLGVRAGQRGVGELDDELRAALLQGDDARVVLELDQIFENATTPGAQRVLIALEGGGGAVERGRVEAFRREGQLVALPR